MLTEGRFKVPIYDFTIKVTVFDNMQEAREKYPHIIKYDMLGCTAEHIGCPECHIIIPHSFVDTIIHEVEHAKNLIWKFIGYSPQPGNDETDAYLIGFIYDKVDKIIKKHLASK